MCGSAREGEVRKLSKQRAAEQQCFVPCLGSSGTQSAAVWQPSAGARSGTAESQRSHCFPHKRSLERQGRRSSTVDCNVSRETLGGLFCFVAGFINAGPPADGSPFLALVPSRPEAAWNPTGRQGSGSERRALAQRRDAGAAAREGLAPRTRALAGPRLPRGRHGASISPPPHGRTAPPRSPGRCRRP